MQRVLVIGPCGAGKSTLAMALAPKLGLPLFHMDQLNWQPGWVESAKADVEARLAGILAQDRWLIDGNYSSSLPQRLASADTVLYLDYPVSLCVRRLLTRIVTYRGRSRPDMTEGCPERFDFAFFLYVLRWNSGPGPRTEKMLQRHAAKVLRFRTPPQLEDWLDRLG